VIAPVRRAHDVGSTEVQLSDQNPKWLIGGVFYFAPAR